MIVAEYHEKDQIGYEEVGRFASDVYWKKLKFDLNVFPDIFVSLKNEDSIIGCIGFNFQMRCPLLVNDKRVADIICNDKVSLYGEQSVLAIKKGGNTMSALISILSVCSYYSGFRKVFFAAGEKPFDAVKEIGFKVIDCGQADGTVLPDSEKNNFELWLNENKPRIGIVDLNNALGISRLFFEKNCEKIEPGLTLKKFMEVKKIESF